MDEREYILKEGKVSHAINKMAIPAIIGLLVMAIYSTVDTMFVAWIGEGATSATQVVFPIMMLSTAIGLTFGIGSGSLISRLIGNRNIEKAKTVSSIAFFTGLIIGIMFMILALVFNDELFRLFGATDEIIVLTKDYGIYIIIGIPIMVLNMVLNNLLRSEGSSKLSMVGMAIGALLNIILDPLLIFGLNMGIAGAAIATSFSQLITLFILLYQYISKKTILSIKLRNYELNLQIYKEILVVGLPTFIKQLLFAISIGLLNQSAMKYGGTQMLDAISIITRVTVISTNIIFGLGQGFQPVAGYNAGANNRKRVFDSLSYTLKISTLVSIGTSILFIILAKPIYLLFQTSTEVMHYGIRGLTYYAIGMITLGFTNTVAVFYQSLGRGKEALVLSALRQGFVLIPVIFIFPIFFEGEGVLMSQMVSDILTTFITILIFIPVVKNKHSFILQKATI